MSLVVPTLRAVVRDELLGVQQLALASVTAADTNADGSGARNVEVNAKLHGSDLELQRVPSQPVASVCRRPRASATPSSSHSSAAISTAPS